MPPRGIQLPCQLTSCACPRNCSAHWCHSSAQLALVDWSRRWPAPDGCGAAQAAAAVCGCAAGVCCAVELGRWQGACRFQAADLGVVVLIWVWPSAQPHPPFVLWPSLNYSVCSSLLRRTRAPAPRRASAAAAATAPARPHTRHASPQWSQLPHPASCLVPWRTLGRAPAPPALPVLASRAAVARPPPAPALLPGSRRMRTCQGTSTGATRPVRPLRAPMPERAAAATAATAAATAPATAAHQCQTLGQTKKRTRPGTSRRPASCRGGDPLFAAWLAAVPALLPPPPHAPHACSMRTSALRCMPCALAREKREPVTECPTRSFHWLNPHCCPSILMKRLYRPVQSCLPCSLYRPLAFFSLPHAPVCAAHPFHPAPRAAALPTARPPRRPGAAGSSAGGGHSRIALQRRLPPQAAGCTALPPVPWEPPPTVPRVSPQAPCLVVVCPTPALPPAGPPLPVLRSPTTFSSTPHPP